MATAVQLDTEGDYPTVRIENIVDARVLCEILTRNGVAVNVRQVD